MNRQTSRPSLRRQSLRRGGVGASIAALLLLGCSDPRGLENAAARSKGSAGVAAPKAARADRSVSSPAPNGSATDPVASDAPSVDETKGGDGSPITLTALSSADVTKAQLAGELRCSFSTASGSPLLVASGDVASTAAASGVVKVGGFVEPVAAPGGYDGMAKGATFTGQGKTLRIAPTGPAAGGGESPPVPATLTFERADGASRTYAGSWTCGP